MKLRYFLTSLAAAAVFAVGCAEVEDAHLAELQVSKSYIALPEKGGEQEIEVNAVADWAISDEIPSWLTVEPASGKKGKTTVKFKVEASDKTNEALLHFVCGKGTQLVNVLQMAAPIEPELSTVKSVNESEDGVIYRVKGVCTSITNTLYGNWYLQDETGSILIYGTLFEGADKQFTKLGLEVGDIVTVQGPKKTFNGTIELVDVTVISIEKSLIKVESIEPEEAELPIEGGQFVVNLTVKGNGLTVEVPEAAKSWLTVASVNISGTSATVVFDVAANAGGDRNIELTFKTKQGDTEYTAVTSFLQKGAIIPATVSEFLAAAEGDTFYRVSGAVKNISANAEFHNAKITVVDAFGNEFEAYRAVVADGNIEDKGIAAGDVITVVGKRSSFNGKPQMAAACTVEEHFPLVTIAAFNAAADNTVMAVKGKITKVSSLSESFNNVCLDIEDESGSTYIYRCAAPGGNISAVNLAEGGEVVVMGSKTTYDSKPQMNSGGKIYSYTAPAGGEDPGVTYLLGSNSYDDGVATINGVEGIKVLKIGTSKAAGDITFTVPAGSNTLKYTAVAWKGAATTLEFSVGGTLIKSQAIAANDGATSNSPYTINTSASDDYVVEYNFTTDTQVKMTTASGAKTRAIIFNVAAE